MSGGHQSRGVGLWGVLAGVLALVSLVLFLNVGLVSWYVGSFHVTGPQTPEMRAGPVDRWQYLKRQGRALGANISATSGDAGAPQWPLFWVLTAPMYESTRCREVLASWGRFVPPDSLVFLGAATNETTDEGHRFVALDVPPQNKSRKELLAWRFLARSFPERKWYVKGDDDTFFVVGNLNRYLEEFDPQLPYFLGCKFHLSGRGGVQYVSGGAGYALSAAAAWRLALAVPRCLRKFANVSEGDLAVGECLQTAGVVPEDTRDAWGRQRFHAFTHEMHAGWLGIGPNLRSFWYSRWLWGSAVEGVNCCGEDTSVSFHYMAGRMRGFHWPPPPGTADVARAEAMLDARRSTAV
mmetsp:Transcript_106967/g.319881  ORF Transcript_106967/g.319881 Transcript_106967/m.319881 type:complete len:352 (-) Transcript_106967:70-1125(-)